MSTTTQFDSRNDAETTLAEILETMAVDEFDELGKPSEDPVETYIHVGKRYRLIGGGPVFEIAHIDRSGPAGGVVILESESGDLVDECDSDIGGVSRDVLAPYTTEEPNRAVWTVNGILASVRKWEISEIDVWSYSDLYWTAFDAVEFLESDD